MAILLMLAGPFIIGTQWNIAEANPIGLHYIEGHASSKERTHVFHYFDTGPGRLPENRRCRCFLQIAKGVPVDIGVGKAVDTTNINGPVLGFIVGLKGLIYNLTLEGSKFTKPDKKK
ncbi:MAG: hypothetical protein ACYCWB_01590 [Thiobacillus sp.]